jgi:hypothetical protein
MALIAPGAPGNAPFAGAVALEAEDGAHDVFF